MQYAPARRALAGSVLVLGSVGTVSAVHLDSASTPSAPDSRSAAAMAPPARPAPGPAATAPGAEAPADSGSTAPSRSDRAPTRRSSGASDRPVSSRDLIEMARGPRGGGVVVPAHDIERTAPLRSALRPGRHGVISSGLRSLDDMLDFDDVRDSGRGQRSFSRALDGDRRAYRSGSLRSVSARADSDDFDDDFEGSNFHTADYGWTDGDGWADGEGWADGNAHSGRSGAGVNRAEYSWGSDDVSHSRPRCGRHRA